MSKALTLTDILIERRRKEEKYFKDYLKWAKKIKGEAGKLLGKVEVFVFGSMATERAEPGSDIDILVISPKLNTSSKKSETRVKILKKIGMDTPFEIHLITPKEYQEWYGQFIKEKIKI